VWVARPDRVDTGPAYSAASLNGGARRRGAGRRVHRRVAQLARSRRRADRAGAETVISRFADLPKVAKAMEVWERMDG
jgi:hypothetical protein